MAAEPADVWHRLLHSWAVAMPLGLGRVSPGLMHHLKIAVAPSPGKGEGAFTADWTKDPWSRPE